MDSESPAVLNDLVKKAIASETPALLRDLLQTNRPPWEVLRVYLPRFQGLSHLITLIEEGYPQALFHSEFATFNGGMLIINRVQNLLFETHQGLVSCLSFVRLLHDLANKPEGIPNLVLNLCEQISRTAVPTCVYDQISQEERMEMLSLATESSIPEDELGDIDGPFSQDWAASVLGLQRAPSQEFVCLAEIQQFSSLARRYYQKLGILEAHQQLDVSLDYQLALLNDLQQRALVLGLTKEDEVRERNLINTRFTIEKLGVLARKNPSVRLRYDQPDDLRQVALFQALLYRQLPDSVHARLAPKSRLFADFLLPLYLTPDNISDEAAAEALLDFPKALANLGFEITPCLVFPLIVALQMYDKYMRTHYTIHDASAIGAAAVIHLKNLGLPETTRQADYDTVKFEMQVIMGDQEFSEVYEPYFPEATEYGDLLDLIVRADPELPVAHLWTRPRMPLPEPDLPISKIRRIPVYQHLQPKRVRLTRVNPDPVPHPEWFFGPGPEEQVHDRISGVCSLAAIDEDTDFEDELLAFVGHPTEEEEV